MKGFIVTLTGPSCSGKSTLEKMLKEQGFVSAVSVTTRAPREGEHGGENYYFVTKEKFDELKAEGAFVESTEFNGNQYGVTKAELDYLAKLGSPIVIVFEPNGQKEFEKYATEAGFVVYSVFVNVPAEIQAKRFLTRAMGDAMKSITASDCSSDKTLDTYASRMATMMTVERKWVIEAYMNNQLRKLPYSLLLDRFDESNQDEAITKIKVACNMRSLLLSDAA